MLEVLRDREKYKISFFVFKNLKWNWEINVKILGVNGEMFTYR